jgi:hypothetical protein
VKLSILQVIQLEEAIAKCARDGEGRLFTLAYMAEKADCTDEEALHYLEGKHVEQAT